MKKSIFSKVGAAAMVLTLVTASLVGGTFAKYTSTASGTATATAAKWSIAMKEGVNTITDGFTLNLKNENPSVVTTDNKLAPGANGKIELTIDGTGSEIGYHYLVKADGANLGDLPIVFYTDKDDKVTSTVDLKKGLTTIADDKVILDNVGNVVPVTLYWEWDSSSANDKDTELGEAATSGTIALSVTAEQLSTTVTQ